MAINHNNRNQKPNFRFSFRTLAQEDLGFYIRVNLLGVTQTVFFMVLEETQTSTSSTSAAIANVTQCAGGDAPSSAVLDSPGQESQM